RLDEAREHAQTAVSIAPERDRRSQSAGHELLARIALAEGDADAARAEAERAQQADPVRPVTLYIDARLLYDQGQYADALPLLEKAIAALKKSTSPYVAGLHGAAADCLVRLDRPEDAAREYNEELKLVPQDLLARAGLAMLYQSTGDSGAAERTLA